MTAFEWAKLKRWFEESTEGTPLDAERAMAEAQSLSPELAQELGRLLQQHGSDRLNSRSVLEQFPPPVEIQPAERIGPYRILGELGRGGTCIVFRAERADDQFHRPVALKLLRFSIRSSGSAALLTRERRALSQLRHANIASLVDWGETDDGTPWLAVEYVDGLPIDQYALAAGGMVDVGTALDLFEQACAAVQYAHQNLVVHGDLKPQNIYVSATGTVKLLDFGLARILDLDATLTVDRRLTPAYASPEQVEGKPTGVATDVYSLGVLLYELLAGVPRFPNASMESVFRRILDGTAELPSSRPEVPDSRKRILRGDLDHIVAHAMQRDPDSRYPTVEHFRADIQAYRRGFPVQATKQDSVYLVRKFVRRNFRALAAAALAVLGLATGTAVALWKERQAQVARQAAERRDQALRKLAHSVIFDLHDTINRIPASVDARRKLVTVGLQYLDALDKDRTDDAATDDSLQMELAHGYYRMAYALGGTVGLNLGDAPAARRSYRAALAILDRQAQRHPGDHDIDTLHYAVAFNYALTFNNPADGIALALPYRAAADAAAQRDPTGGPLISSGLMHEGLGKIYRNAGDLEKSLAELDNAMSVFGKLDRVAVGQSILLMVQSTVGRDQSLHLLSLTGAARAGVLIDMGHPADGLLAIEQALRDEELALSFDRRSPPGRRQRAVLHGFRSRALLMMGRRADAIAAARAEVEAVNAFLAADDSSLIGRRDQTQANRHLANALIASDPATAATLLKEAAQGIAAIGDADPEFLYNRVLQAGTQNELAFALLRLGLRDAATGYFRLSHGLAAETVEKAPTWVDPQRELAMAESGLLQTGASRLPESCLAAWLTVRSRSPLRHTAEDAPGVCR
jgi:serine/threonine protein kinase/tetratricopeptide (TPR) repeat protein